MLFSKAASNKMILESVLPVGSLETPQWRGNQPRSFSPTSPPFLHFRIQLPSICACGNILAYVFVLVAKSLVVVFVGACLSVYLYICMWRENGAQRAERRTEKRIRPWSRIDKDEKWKPAVVRARLHHILNSLLGAGLNSSKHNHSWVNHSFELVIFN